MAFLPAQPTPTWRNSTILPLTKRGLSALAPRRRAGLKSRLQEGASLSPHNDLGEWRQRESLAVFPTLKKTKTITVRASQEIPAKRRK